MILALEQYKQSTAAMRDKLTEIAGGLHLDDLRRELEELKEEMNADGFWNDLERSTHVNRRIAAIEGKIKHYESLVSAVDDLEVMIDLANEEDDESMLEEITAESARLDEQIEALKADKTVLAMLGSKIEKLSAKLKIKLSSEFGNPIPDVLRL